MVFHVALFIGTGNNTMEFFMLMMACFSWRVLQSLPLGYSNYAGMFLRHGCGCKSENVYLWFAMGAHACNSIIAEPDTRGLKHIQGLPGSQNTWEDQISKQSHIVKPCVCVRAPVCVSVYPQALTSVSFCII